MGSGASKPTTNVSSGAPTSSLPKKLETTPDQMQQETTTTNATTTPSSSVTSDVTESSGGCPMKRNDGSYSYDWSALWKSPHRPGGSKPLDEQTIQSSKKETCDKKECIISNNNNNSSSSTGGGCPVKQKSQQQQQQYPEYNVYSQPIDKSNNMPSNKTATQLPAPVQSQELSTERVSSSIPKGGASEGTVWTYPSPQMFYNALARKGKLGDTSEQDMESVVALHNNMNEKTWAKVLEWEQVYNGETTENQEESSTKLLRFQGRPTDLSPKAAFKHYLLGHPLPFDRHDWVILRQDGTTVRYVIDYYYDETRARESPDSALPAKHDVQATPSLLVDVRPALDSPTACWQRAIQMPLARHVMHSTLFEPLPMRPTATMQSQVQESVAVWQSIQQQKQLNERQEQQQDDEPPMTLQQAQELVRSFDAVKTKCQAQQQAIASCHTDQECASASMDWTVCTASLVCSLQHQALIKALSSDSDDNDSVVEAALTNLTECVKHKTILHGKAKQVLSTTASTE